MEIGIGHQDSSLRVVLAVPKLIPFVRSVAKTTRVSIELPVMCILDVVSQVTGPDNILRWVHRVNIIFPQLSSVARISRVPLLVPLVGDAQTNSILFSPGRIRKVLLICSMVCYKFSICMFTLC